ncbi:MAG: GMC family oxidoreductase N-terminal domain-containing protein [Candidatus Promineifilaceae bacterium]|nr:GMC family oxidoreductase N-terminal domain-containing protein [Candidatus Promineifilaceae bacterium]
MKKYDADIVIIGSGPGGATLARQLSRSAANWRIILLERGRDWRRHRLYGTYPGAMLYTDKASFLATSEGLSIIRPLMLGGATSMYCACAADPLPWWHEKYGIDLSAYSRETRRELRIRPLPPKQRGVASTRIAEAAIAVGQEWTAQDKFMIPERTSNFNCRAVCMLGCRCGAKWNAAEYVDEALVLGCELWTRAYAKKIIIDSSQAIGVQGTVENEPFFIKARHVILAAGGIGSATLLQRSGFQGPGQGMTMDTTVMVYGYAPYKGNGNEPPMTWSYADYELGVLYSTLIDPWLNYPVAMIRKGPAYSLTWHRWGRTLGVMIKLKDETSGKVTADGQIYKGLTMADQQKLRRAEQIARKILIKAGCNPDTMFTTPLRGTHPSGTVRIGHSLNQNLETEIENLYVCDASVFPEALARPTVLTIISLAKRLADYLIQKHGIVNISREDVLGAESHKTSVE